MSIQLLAQKLSRTTPIGLDIGEHGIRAAQLHRRGGNWCVAALSRIARQDNQPQNDGRWCTRTDFAACIEQQAFRGRDVVTGLNDPDVEFHSLSMPEAVRASAGGEQAVAHEISHLMTFDAGEVEMRHWAVPSQSPSSPNVVGVAAKREPIMQLWQQCRDAGLCCTRADSAALANARFTCLVQQHKPSQVWGVLDVGASQCRLILGLGDVPVLLRSVGRGAHAWTVQIAEALSVSASTAVVKKHQHGIGHEARGARADSSGEPEDSISPMLFGVLRGELHRLAAEIKRSFEYVLGCFRAVTAGQLLLVGGGSLLKRLPLFLSDSLGIEVKAASELLNDPTCRLRMSSATGQQVEHFATAIGLALPVTGEIR